MTSSEAKSSKSVTYTIPKKMVNENVVRKASFKCSTPNRTASQRISRKVVVPLSTVQALTFKFNELAQLEDGSKPKLSQAAVKNLLSGSGKTNTIKVVICRKPSTSKHNKSDEVLLTRKISLKRFQEKNNRATIEDNRNTHRSVHQKITEFEEKKKNEINSKRVLNVNKSRTMKMQVPKVLVDIDLDGDSCLVNHKNSKKSESEGIDSEVVNNPENSLSVRTAICLFEQNSKNNFFNDKNVNEKVKSNSKTFTDGENAKEPVLEIKSKPVAAIKPILKKPDNKSTRKTKLLPNDSLNRKRYVQMKRESAKEEKDLKNSHHDDVEQSNSEKENEEVEADVNDSINKPVVILDPANKTFQNDSSLHKQIKGSNFTVITTEIHLQDEQKTTAAKTYEYCGNLNQNRIPNSSFLWSKKEEIYAEKPQIINRLDLPLPVPPENYVPNFLDENEDALYDDVLPKNQESESEEFEKINDEDEDVDENDETYDDVGEPYWKNNKTTDRNTYGNKIMSQIIQNEEVREKNLLNKMADLKSDYNQENGKNMLYLYDDGEGEKYQYISDISEITNSGVLNENELELYQYIQNNKEDGNIYEDIQSIKSNMITKDKTKDIYEDINCTVNSEADNDFINNCYESVYNGIYSTNNGSQGYIKSDLSDTSNNSGKSSTYEKSNSLYGMSAGNERIRTTDHRLSMGDLNNSPENSGYHMTLFGSACPNSETSQSNSDEWIEVSESESEETYYLMQERPRKSKVGNNNSWSQKDKKRWKKLQRKSNFNEEMKFGNSEGSLFYEEASNPSIYSESSRESTFKKRPHIGDIIFISSHSIIYLGDIENKLIALHGNNHTDDTDKLKILFSIPRPALRKKHKPSPTIRVLLYKTDNRECQENTLFLEEEIKLQDSEDHFYESVGHYENAEIIQETARSCQGEQDNNYVNKDHYNNDEQFIDDFDSQSSEDEAYVDAKLPDIPNQGYNLTKSLRAAGKKLRKNFSLRKNDLSKSLKRFKKSSRAKVVDLQSREPSNPNLGIGKEVEVDSLTQKPSESPSTPPNLSNSIYSNNSDSSSSSHNINKSSNNSLDSKNQRHRKSWTFRSKFKNSSTDVSDVNSAIDANRNSTFYLSLNEVKPKKTEKKNDLLNEIQSAISKRNSNSSESVTDKDIMRHSDSVSTLTKFRPSVPPPPPPLSKPDAAAPEKTKYSDILWGEKATNNCLYVESGLFDKQKKHSRCSDSDTSLYAEIGLYAANDEFNSRKTQMFVDEPLYQFYTECVNQRARDDILNNYDSEGYEEINDYYSVINEKRRTIDIKNVRPNFEDFNEDVNSKISSLRSISDRRTLWCQIPAVIDSCILQTLSDQARKLQEAKFEIITSEGSYMNSLNVLENHFMKKVNDLNIITKRDFRILFSNIVSVKKCSESFLEDLENCWQNNIMLNGICDIVYKHSTTSFQVYTKYCKNQVCIYRTLRELLDKNWNFENALKEIESDPICQNLNIHSFLMLPMQRITRLPLLMGAVLARMDKDDDEFEVCKASFDVLNKIVQDCDDEARRMEKCEEMLILSQQIEFPKDIRRIPIITGSRFLVKSGQVTQLVNRDENKLTFGKKFSKVTLTLFLFTDLLIVAKKKNPRNYVVVDHCPRNLVQMQTTDGLTQLPVKLNSNSDASGKLLMLLTMLENHEKKTVEMILSFEMESDKQRWLEAVTPKSSENPNECIYEEWDCPQVIALYEFTPVQPDELNLCIGDVVNVLKKMSDGWYQGERLRDGARGWFPQNHTQEVSSSHIRAKNKKLRYKLLALSGNLIDSQKMNGK